MLRSNSLKCSCNWELGGVDLVFSKEHFWIFEKNDRELFIYEWTNQPTDKPDNLIMEKKLFKKLKW
jgi:hypothetical protein